MSQSDDDILTVGEVAAELRCSKAHVYNVINGSVAGVTPLPVIIIGRRRVLLRSTLSTAIKKTPEPVGDL